MENIKFIINKSELGAGTRGASMGAEALNIAALDHNSNLFSQFPIIEIENHNEILFEEIQSPHGIHIRGIADMYARIAETIKNEIDGKNFPIIISGDHSSAGGTIAGLRMKYPDKRIGVIWIDAHADIHTPYTTPSGNVHGMPLAASLGLDHLEAKKNDIEPQTKEAWEKMKNTGGICPKINPEDLLYIALRDYEQEEKDLIERLGIKTITVDKLRAQGVPETVTDCAIYLENCDYIYISYDVDSLDSEISEGTGTPVPHGLHVDEAKELLAKLIYLPKVICWEITEINPTLDESNKMAETNFEILQHCVKEVLVR